MLGEFADGAIPVALLGLDVFEEESKDVDELDGTGDFIVELDASVLDEEGVGGGLEEDVGARVAEGELLLCLGSERVFSPGVFDVFGFPSGAWEVEGVN